MDEPPCERKRTRSLQARRRIGVTHNDLHLVVGSVVWRVLQDVGGWRTRGLSQPVLLGHGDRHAVTHFQVDDPAITARYNGGQQAYDRLA